LIDPNVINHKVWILPTLSFSWRDVRIWEETTTNSQVDDKVKALIEWLSIDTVRISSSATPKVSV